MKIALVQTDLQWEDPAGNRAQFETLIFSLSSPVDLIVLPEMFTTGFTMNASVFAENMDGETVNWLKKMATENDCAITVSLIIAENGNFYNRLLFVFPSGEIQYYDKRHLFTLANENVVYTKGKERLIVEYRGFKICPLICYDLRFPVFSRNTDNFDLLIYVANWPKVRIQAWDVLLKARAIENVCYSIGVNRVGVDAHGFEHNGHSQCLDYLGNELISPQEKQGIFVVELDKNKLEQTKKKMAFLDDKDQFSIQF